MQVDRAFVAGGLHRRGIDRLPGHRVSVCGRSSFGMDSTVIGLLAAFSFNAIACGVGALMSGRLGNKFGRKRIYSPGLLVYIAACSSSC